jgi:hypothetical protein
MYRQGKRSAATSLLPQGLYVKFGKINDLTDGTALTHLEKLPLEILKIGSFYNVTITDVFMIQFRIFGRR